MIQPPEKFERIERLPPYVFAEVNKLKAELRAKGKDVIDFGMGNPDSPTPQHIVDKLVETVKNPDTHRYSMSKGIPGLRKAIAGYYKRRFDADINPETEAVVTIGSKEGLVNMANAISKPGDVFLVPDPCYPIHEFGFKLAGADVLSLPKFTNQTLFEQVKDVMEDKKRKVKPIALVLNYPCNPTSETVDLAFYEEAVQLAKHYGFWLLSDLAYCEIYFDEPTPSIMQVKGAKDVAVEFTTMSKTYSMPGWRVGFCVGNQKLIYALTRIKSYVDYGCFTPIQVASAYALNSDQKCVDDFRKLYKDRRDVLIEGLNKAGWAVEAPSAGMFVWAKIPEKFRKLGSLEFSKKLMEEAEVAVAPGIGFGKYGDEYVRIALIENKQRTRQATRNIKKFLQS